MEWSTYMGKNGEQECSPYTGNPNVNGGGQECPPYIIRAWAEGIRGKDERFTSRTHEATSRAPHSELLCPTSFCESLWQPRLDNAALTSL